MVKICKDGRKWGRNNSYNKQKYKEKLSEAKKGMKNPFWKDGRSKGKFKYKQVYDKKLKKVIYVHRKLMEEYLKRKLLSSEIVHHKNGDVTDNRIENLELIENGRKNHAKFHSDNRRLNL